MIKVTTLLLKQEKNKKKNTLEWIVYTLGERKAGGKNPAKSFTTKEKAMEFISNNKTTFVVFVFSSSNTLDYKINAVPAANSYTCSVHKKVLREKPFIRAEIEKYNFSGTKITDEKLDISNEPLDVPKEVSELISVSQEELKIKLAEEKRINKEDFEHRKQVNREKDETQEMSRDLLKQVEKIQLDIEREKAKTAEFQLKLQKDQNKISLKKQKQIELSKKDAIITKSKVESSKHISKIRANTKVRLNLEKRRFARLLEAFKEEEAKIWKSAIEEFKALKDKDDAKLKKSLTNLNNIYEKAKKQHNEELNSIKETQEQEIQKSKTYFKKLTTRSNNKINKISEELDAEIKKISRSSEREIKKIQDKRDLEFALLKKAKDDFEIQYAKDKDVQEAKFLDHKVLTNEKINKAKESHKKSTDELKDALNISKEKLRKTDEAEKAKLNVVKEEISRALNKRKEKVVRNLVYSFKKKFKTSRRFIELALKKEGNKWNITPVDEVEYYQFNQSFTKKATALEAINNIDFSTIVYVHDKNNKLMFTINKDYTKRYQTLKIEREFQVLPKTFEEAKIIKTKLLKHRRRVEGLKVVENNLKDKEKWISYGIVSIVTTITGLLLFMFLV